ncbi:hypothetical protein [Sediminibacillus massiliensis]|uniref:hypothetical protein n=1 Tax=Sediminibacillus massiliensis TaxID=1926277 RepID=UPI00098858AE|nr:hypothetical protein [Sediminibacillus massiliensis]
MAKLSFDVNSKAYDEVEIAGEDYKLFYDDESLKRYQKQAQIYSKKASDYAKKQDKIPEMSEKERKKLEDEGFEFVKEFIETFLGAGSYEKMYQACGKSMINLVGLINQIMEWLDSKLATVDDKKKQRYKPKRKK